MFREAEREEAGKVSISSSSWVQVGGGDKEGVQRVHVVQEVNGNQVVDKEGEEEVEEDKKEEQEAEATSATVGDEVGTGQF